MNSTSIRASILFFVLLQSFAQTFNICGKLIDEETQKPISLAKVIISGTTIGLLTDSLGKFCFHLKDVKQTKISLSFTHVNYQPFDTLLYLNDTNTIIKLFIVLKPTHYQTEEITITAKRTGIETIHGSMVLESDLTHLLTYKGTEKALQNFPGVWLQQTTPSTLRPFLLGLGDLRVATIVDNILIENQSISADHGLPMIAEGSDKVEVYYGPNNLPPAYDAIAGSFQWTLLDLHRPSKNQLQFQTELSNGYNGARTFLKWDQHLTKWDGDFTLALGGQYNGNMTLPEQFLNHSGSQRLMVASGIRKHFSNLSSSLNLRYWNDQNQIPHFEHEEEHFSNQPFSREEKYPLLTQTNLLISNSYEYFWRNWYLKPTLGFFRNHIAEYEDTSIANLSMLTQTYSFNLPATWTGSSTLQLNMGIYSSFQSLTNTGDQQLLPSYQRLVISFPFAFQKYLKPWTLHLRTRLTFGQYQRRDSLNSALQYLIEQVAVGIYRTMNHFWSIRLEGIRGKRMPSPLELYANGPHHADRTFLIGSDSLLPEVIHQIFLLNEFHFHDFNIHLVLYAGNLDNWLTRVGTQDTLETFPVYLIQNQKGRLSGFNLYFHWHPHQAHWLHLEGNASVIHMKFQSPADFVQIPQSRATLRVRTENPIRKNKLQFTFEGNWLDKIKRDYLPEELPEAFFINASIGFIMPSKQGKWFFNLGGNNLFNQPYYEALSPLSLYSLPMYGKHGYFQLGFQI